MKIAVLILLPFLILALVAGCQGHRDPRKPIKGLDLRSDEKQKETGSGMNNNEGTGNGNVDSEFSNSETINSTKSIKIKEEPEAETSGNDEDFDDNNSMFDDDANIDILKNEGQPGWMEKLLEKVKSKSRKSEKSGDESQIEGKFSEKKGFSTKLQDEPPSAALTKLTEAFNKLGTKATGAKNGLTELKNKWNTMDAGDRETVTGTLQTAADNIEAFTNAGENPVGAVQGALNMVAQVAALAGPTGQIISVALSFVSGFLSLFGVGGEKQKPIGEIVREQIDEALDEHYQKTLTSQIDGAINLFKVSKEYVDYLAQNGKKLTVDQALVTQVNVPLWQGVELMGTLSKEIENLLKANKRADAKKVLKYIELYTTMAVLKDIVMQELVALFPDELAPNREALMAVQKLLRDTQKSLLKYLYEGDANNVKISLPYFDPDIYPITDAYLGTVLQIPNYGRSMAGKWCITPQISGKKLIPLTWTKEHRELVSNGHPYVTTGNDGCFWKLVPHGKNLYTIVNTYGCPDNSFCGQYMSFDIKSGKRNRVTVETDADLWEIYGDRQKRIRSKYGCGSNDWCNMQLGPQTENVGRLPLGLLFGGYRPGENVQTFGLTNRNVGFVWWITKTPPK